MGDDSEFDDRHWSERYSEEEVRREARRYSEAYYAMVKALKQLPEVPDWRVLKLLSHAAKFPEDANIGKRLQMEHGFDAIAPKLEYEMGAGLWSRIRSALKPE